jgi:hypothetical protein
LLLNYERDELLGIFRASSQAQANIDPKAWKGKFIAQVRVELVRGRSKPASPGRVKTGHIEEKKICPVRFLNPTMSGFQEAGHGESAQDGNGQRDSDSQAAGLV